MKVLFAVNNEKISEAIIKKYQTMYKEIISWKNVYFFNAIIKELQKDKSYDRIVIGEDLEPFANNNYEVIDNFLYDKLDSISDEASNSREGDIPIILIATDRREKGESLLVKLFGIGVYNVLLGSDRKIDNVCKLIYQPRTKKEAKTYYRVEADDVGYSAVDPDNVSEIEIQNIIRHYKKIGKDESKYVESFEEIATQYTDTQLKLITKFLPLNVRAVLEEKCPKYQQVMIGSVKGQVAAQKASDKQFTATNIQSKNVNKIELIDKELQKSKLTKPVVIPSTINMQNVKKSYKNVEKEPVEKSFVNQTDYQNSVENVESKPDNIYDMNKAMNNSNSLENLNNSYEFESQINNLTANTNIANPLPQFNEEEKAKKGRGRPKKQRTPEEIAAEENKVKKGRGRPKKVTEQPNEENGELEGFVLPNVLTDDEPDNVNDVLNNINVDSVTDESAILPGLEENTILPGLEENTTSTDVKDDFSLPGLSNENTSQPAEQYQNTNNNQYVNTSNYSYTNTINTQIQNVNPVNGPDAGLANLITGDKKIVAFVGTSKNGTSFLVNNLAVNLSGKGINTAILDLTRNKNAYYIYTSNEDALREKSFRCIDGLRSGIADGIQVNKNLTVYTTLPGENPSFNDYSSILATLAKNYSLILLDCDFETDLNYFANSQEIYLVQTYDILTIQPLTAFLNELKHKNILDQNKLRIVINKTLRLRKLTDQMIIGGISCYNDPASTYINTLFDREKIRYTTIPFEDQTYARYLERLVDCEISLNGYSKIFLEALEKLSNMVYPLIAGNAKYTQNKNYNDYSKKNTKINTNTAFNSNMNATLNRMRNNF